MYHAPMVGPHHQQDPHRTPPKAGSGYNGVFATWRQIIGHLLIHGAGAGRNGS